MKYCVCQEGFEGDDCTIAAYSIQGTQTWLPTIWVAVGVVAGVILLNQFYTSCRKVYLRRTGREGFSRVHDQEEVQLAEESHSDSDGHGPTDFADIEATMQSAIDDHDDDDDLI